jgi:hypothetical protein
MAQSTCGAASFWVSFIVAAASGVAVEIGVGAMGHRREAWDSVAYWSFGLPLMVLVALVCGFVARRKAVPIGYAPFGAQLVTMVVKTGAGSMLPLGVIFMAILGLSGVAAAFGGGWIGRTILGPAGGRIGGGTGQ